MCVTVRYVCPACREDSGHSATFHCPNRDDCGEPTFFTHLMRAEHFRDWFCATKHCGYSRVNQTWDEREIMEALRAVEDESGSEGGDHDPENGNDDDDAASYMSIDSSAEPTEPATSNVVCLDNTSASNANTGQNAGNIKTNRTPLPDAPRSRQLTVQPAAQGSQAVSQQPAAAAPSPLGLPIFDTAVTDCINALRTVIVQGAHGHPKQWSKEEDELLKLLHDQGVSDKLISGHYLNRTLHACEGHMSFLRRKRRAAEGRG